MLRVIIIIGVPLLVSGVLGLNYILTQRKKEPSFDTSTFNAYASGEK